MVFFGKYAQLIKKYSQSKQGDSSVDWIISDGEGKTGPAHLFSTYYSCLYAAAVLGLLEQRKIQPAADSIDRSAQKADVFADMIVSHHDQLVYLYKLMVLTDPEIQLSNDERVRKAFTSVPKEKETIEMDYFKEYIYGGLEIIDDLFGKASSYEDISNAVSRMIQKYESLLAAEPVRS
jgi:hypothetical protein